jgi:hypothetical protein
LGAWYNKNTIRPKLKRKKGKRSDRDYFVQCLMTDIALDRCEVDPKLSGPHPSVAIGGMSHEKLNKTKIKKKME